MSAADNFTSSRDMPFPSDGVDVNSPIDEPKSPKKAARLKNLTVDIDGSLVIRPGLVDTYNHVINAAKTSIHSIRRITDAISGLYARVIGTQDRLAIERVTIPGATLEVDSATPSLTYSGNPLTIIPWRPSQSQKPHAYIYDSVRQRKLAYTDSITKPIGIPAPFRPPWATLGSRQYIEIAQTSAAAPWNLAGNTDNTFFTPPSVVVFNRINTGIDRYVIDDGWAAGAPAMATWSPTAPDGLKDIGPGTLLRLANGLRLATVLVTEVYKGSAATISSALLYDSGATGYLTIQPQTSYKEFRKNAIVRVGSVGSGTEEYLRILEANEGPNGTISFRVKANNGHGLFSELQVLDSFRAFNPEATGFNWSTGGTTVTTNTIQTVATGPGQAWIQANGLSVNLSTFANGIAITDSEYFHISLWSLDWSRISLLRIMFDFDDGSFTKNFSYRAIEQSALVAASQGTSAPSDAQRKRLAQLANQRAISSTTGFRSGRGENDPRFDNPGQREQDSGTLNDQNNTDPSTTVSNESGTGDSQWSEMRWRRGEMFRVGTDLSKSWNKVVAVRIEATGVSGLPSIAFSSIIVYGGGQVDIGDIEIPVQYRYRYRDSATGAVSDYSPADRNGTIAYRDSVYLGLDGVDPSTTGADKIDIERFGANLRDWYYVGTTNNTAAGIGNMFFTDNIDDIAALRNELISGRRAIQPWVRDLSPLSGTCDVAGTVAFFYDGLRARILPGTAVVINGIATTLRSRRLDTGVPSGDDTLISIWELEDSLGYLPAAKYEIPQPRVSGESLARVFGIFANCLFVCDGPFLRWTEGNDPDATHERNVIEVTDPSDPLVGGFVLNGRAGLLSTRRMFSLSGDPVNGFEIVELPFSQGCYSPYSIAVGPQAAWIARDGIYTFDGTRPVNITTADLAPLFPLEGKSGQNTTWLTAPRLTATEKPYLRLAWLDDGSLIFTYRSVGTTFVHMRYVPSRKQWFPYEYGVNLMCFYAEEGDGVSGVLAGSYDLTGGRVYTVGGSTNPSTDNGVGFPCVVRPFSNDFGDSRPDKLYSDIEVNMDTANLAGDVTATLLTNDQATSTALGPLDHSASRHSSLLPINNGDGVRGKNASVELSWTTEANKIQRLYWWQLSMVEEPEDITVRAQYPNNAGYDGDKYMQGVRIVADTYGQDKVLEIRYDGGQLGATITINHNGMRNEVYSFPIPFTARLLQIKTTDTDPWKLYDVKWYFNPEPPAAKMWWIQFTGFDILGYKHMPELRPALAATADVSMTLYADTQVSSYVAGQVIPNTGGSGYANMRRPTIILPAKKFKLWAAKFESTTPFRMYLRDMEVLVKGWGADSDYQVLQPFGDVHRTTGALA